MYADDTSVIVSDTNSEAVNKKINETLTHFHSWCKRNHLIINIQKTKYVQFTGMYRNPNDSYQTQLDGKKIERSQAILFL